MASLANVTPGASYPGLLKTENNTGITGSLQQISDGSGILTPLRISTASITNRGGGNIQANTAFGENALVNKTSGGDNVAIGFNAMTLNQTGVNNVAVGRAALYAATGANSNIAIGREPLALATSSSGNIAIGSATMQLTTCPGVDNIAIGQDVLRSSIGSYNTIVGRGAMCSFCGSGSFNTSLGHSTFGSSYPSCQVAIGFRSLQSTSSGYGNTAVGFDSQRFNTAGCLNTSIGLQSLFSNTTASCNAAVGYNAMYFNTTGSNNSVLGSNAQSGNFSCSVILGSCATATANNQFVVGATGSFNAGAVASETPGATHTWLVRINGQNYKILMAQV